MIPTRTYYLLIIHIWDHNIYPYAILIMVGMRGGKSRVCVGEGHYITDLILNSKLDLNLSCAKDFRNLISMVTWCIN